MSIDSIIKSAIHFLLKSQHPDGWWEDFQLAPGSSNVWVTAYIARILAIQDCSDAKAAAQRAWIWLSAQKSQGWGYNLLTPPDADSTIWALQLAYALGDNQATSVRNGYNFLRKHLSTDGGVATYATDKEIREFIKAPSFLSFKGWCSPHICVTAAAAGLDDLVVETCDFLRHCQTKDGYWRSYWWCEDEYATNLAVRAIKKMNSKEDSKQIERAVNWAMTRIQSNGSVLSFLRPNGSFFATSLVISILSMNNDQEITITQSALKRAITWLKDHQQDNGSWLGSAGLRVPYPDMLEPENYDYWEVGKKIQGGISLDQNGLFTTATIIESLKLIGQQFSF